MKKIFTLFSFFIVCICFGQSTFKIRSFSNNGSSLQQVIQLTDGSFVSVGTLTYDPVLGNSSLYILKTDNRGNKLASKAVNMSSYDEGKSIIRTIDGGFAVSGSSDSSILLIKFSSALSLQWQKKYSVTDGTLAAAKILQTTDGGYLLTGSKTGSDADSSGVAGCVLKTDASGNLQFAKRYFDYNVNVLYDVAATADGNYTLLGGTEYNYSANDTAYIVKIKPDGSLLWAKSSSNTANSNPVYNQTTHASALLSAVDGGFIFTGEAYNIDSIAGTDQTILVKFNSDGTVAWSKTMSTGAGTENYAYTVMEDKDGGYVFAGELDNYKDNGANDSSFGYMVKTNTAGALQWSKTFEKTLFGYTQFNNLIKTSDGGYAACGEGSFFEDTSYNIGSFLYKINSSFQACNETVGAAGTLTNFGTITSINPAIVNLPINVSSPSIAIVDSATIQNLCSTDVFPLHLLSFTAALQNKIVNIEWKTSNEVNTDHFIVERSGNGIVFSGLQNLTAKGSNGSANSVETYATTDLQPLTGTSYYRLQQVDKSGAVVYSNTVSVTLLANGTLIISPNPVYSSLRILLQSETSANTTFQVSDINGKILASQYQNISVGANTITLPAASLSKGVYVLKVIQNKTVQTIKFIKR